MPGAWGTSWGNAWGNAWGGGGSTPAVAVAEIIVEVLPTVAIRYQPFSPQPSGRVVDVNGATVTTFNGPVTAKVLGGRGRLKVAGNTVNAVNGLWAFTALTPLDATPITLAFSTPG